MPGPLDPTPSTDGSRYMKFRYSALGALAAYAATVPVANWMISHIGQCFPSGPCLIPVGFGLFAPSGVLMVGAALALRDYVHREMGGKAAIAAIAVGGTLSAIFSPPALVLASCLAFVISEIADFAVYAPLAQRRMALAVLASGIVGAAVDSAAFLWVAFGSLDFLAGQVLGKVWITLAACGIVLGRGIK